MFDIIIERLAQSSDVILVLGAIIFWLVKREAKVTKEAKEERLAHEDTVSKLVNSHAKKTKELNGDILQALIDSTAAMVSVDKNYTELRNDLKDKKNGN